MHHPPFVDGQIYHVYNRGVDKRVVFTDPGEHLRFVHHLYEFNNTESARNLTRLLTHEDDFERCSSKDERTPLVHVLAFALMPNHYHLLLQQVSEGGISKYMQKVGTGYTMFFNEKHTRSGALFQGKFKAVHVTNDVQLRYVLHYIHLNPHALCAKEWNESEQVAFLKAYRWSSLPDYIGARSFPSVTQRGTMLDMFDGVTGYEKSLLQAMVAKSFPEGFDPTVLLDLHM